MIKPSLGLIGVVTTLTVAALAAGFVPTAGQAAPSGTPITAAATDDTYVRPSLIGSAGSAGALVVGGPDTAVTYLKFSVPTLPDGSDHLSVSLVLVPVRLAAGSAPTIIDVHTVADTSWTEGSVTAWNPPAVGPVVAVSTLNTAAVTVRFDVSAAVGRTGIFAFAVTAPAGEPQRLFVSKEGGGAPTLTLRRTDGPPAPPTPPTPPTGPPTSPPPSGNCTLGPKLVPTCGVLLGVAPSGQVTGNKSTALTAFEQETGHNQPIFHAYERGTGTLFPTAEQIAIAHETGDPHVLFLNWKPYVASWGSIAAGNPQVDSYIDREAAYIKANYTEPFFFTVHHEPENDVSRRPGSGMTAADYAAMFRHVVLRFRADGVTNMVTVMDYMAYAHWNTQSWWPQLYPGDDVVDWIGWDMYGYSTPHGYGYGDFAEMMSRGRSPQWPGMYAWASGRAPNKPFMIAEWGVWYDNADPTHQAAVFNSVASELTNQFPQVKALVYFDTPHAGGRSSLVSSTPQGLAAYQSMVNLPLFQVSVR